MKLDKKLCRRYADPGKTLDSNNGLLYARQVECIVCTNVKQIGGAPVLILQFFPRERTAQGNYRPVCTMFQSQDDYITLERDERRVAGYFHDDNSAGFSALIKARDAYAYMAARRKERQLAKERTAIGVCFCCGRHADGREAQRKGRLSPLRA